MLIRKNVLCVFCLLCLSFPLWAKNPYSFTNILGSNIDEIGKQDLINLTDFSTVSYSIEDIIQFDYKSEKLKGRVKINLSPETFRTSDAKTKFKAYVSYKVVDYFGLAFGNGFFSAFALDPFYFFAKDGTPSYGKMMQNGLGIYSSVNFKDFSILPIKISLSGNLDSLVNGKELSEATYNFAFDFLYKEKFNLSCTVQNALQDTYLTCATALSLLFIPNFTANLSYVFNNLDKDFIKNKSLHTISLSLAYLMKNINLGFYIDYITGLNKSYVNKDGTKIKQGDFIPMNISSRIEYKVNPNLKINFYVAMESLICNSSDWIFYPSCQYKINLNNTLSSGIRYSINTESNITNLGIPFTWEFSL